MIFAGLPWRSSMGNATNLLTDKAFTVYQEDSNTLIAEGIIFGKDAFIALKFDMSGLYELDVMVATEVKSVWEDYKSIKDVLIEKYGLPTDDNTDVASGQTWSRWEDSQIPNDGEVDIRVFKDQKNIMISYKSSEASRAFKNEIIKEREARKKIQSASKDLF